MAKRHYVYGSGMVGCLYDNGPHCAPTLKQAIESALLPFDHLPNAELKRARRNLRVDGIHYFSTENLYTQDGERWFLRRDGGEPVSARWLAGADYVDVSKATGRMPQGDE